MKNFVKALSKDGRAIAFLSKKFEYLSDAKVTAGIFDGPQIRELMKDEKFDECLSDKELQAWVSFKSIIKNFLGNYRSADYEYFVNRFSYFA